MNKNNQSKLLNNTNMSDREAPELVMGEWVTAGAPVAPTASWQLLVFFMPT